MPPCGYFIGHVNCSEPAKTPFGRNCLLPKQVFLPLFKMSPQGQEQAQPDSDTVTGPMSDPPSLLLRQGGDKVGQHCGYV